MSIKTVVKLSFNNTIRRFEVPVGSFTEFFTAVKDTLGLDEQPVRFSYTDTDNDQVVFDSDQELQEALVHGVVDGVLRVQVNATASSHAAVASPPKSTSNNVPRTTKGNQQALSKVQSSEKKLFLAAQAEVKATRLQLQRLREQIKSLGKDPENLRPALRAQIVAARETLAAKQAVAKQARASFVAKQAHAKRQNKNDQNKNEHVSNTVAAVDDGKVQSDKKNNGKTRPFPLQIAKKRFAKHGLTVKFITPEKAAKLKTAKAVREHRAALQKADDVVVLGAAFVKRVRAVADRANNNDASRAAIETLVDNKAKALLSKTAKQAEDSVVVSTSAPQEIAQKSTAAAAQVEADVAPETVESVSVAPLRPLRLAKQRFLENQYKVQFITPQQVAQLKDDKAALKAFRESKESQGFVVLSAPFVKRVRALAKQHENDREAATQAIHQLVDNKSKVLSRKVPFPLQVVKKRFQQNGLTIKFITPEKRDQLKAMPEKGSFQAYRRSLEAEGDVVMMPAFVKRVRKIADTDEAPIEALHRLADNKSKVLLSKGNGDVSATSPSLECARVNIATKQAEIKAMQQELKVLRRQFKQQVQESINQVNAN